MMAVQPDQASPRRVSQSACGISQASIDDDLGAVRCPMAGRAAAFGLRGQSTNAKRTPTPMINVLGAQMTLDMPSAVLAAAVNAPQYIHGNT
jgi:hypothetical protein